ncbi:uncharacterized protein LOC109705866, partial [Ananas comosus]|uniref:Uncharacterized protein LOC109705866 n=1 Tax=Ananas comosus TaxID=4615 RepID=A0A6P5ELE0_ANACO
MGSLLPIDGQQPKFAQLYIYDTENEIDNRLKAINAVDELQNIDRNIVHSLIEMFDSENEIVKAFRMARDRFRKSDCLPIRLRLIGSRMENTSQYNPPSCSEIAGLIVGDIGSADRHRDIVVEHKTQGLKRISDLHPSFMAMQYPILFPYDEDGFRIDIKYYGTAGKKVGTRKCATMREFYAYRIQNRIAEGRTLISGGKLFQQYLVDAFSCVEEERLDYIRRNQSDLRAEVYKGIKDAIVAGDVDGNAIGKKIILPSSFTAGPRYMMQNYQDAIAICRHCGHPDLFITFTCNTQWLEIENALRFISGQKAKDRPDIVSRVFKMKVEALMADIKSGVYFGKVVADLYTIEFQKRGLPHVHILVWLDASHKSPSSTEIDSIISAEIPDKTIDHVGYEAVSKFMVHGPCGLANSKAPCMAKGRCSKYFPKEFKTETMMDENGFAIYRRRNNGRKVTKNNIDLDNRFVVPHNLRLLIKYQAHMNIEWCSKTRLIKYLFKYINKGPDRTRAVIEDNYSPGGTDSVDQYKQVDEIKQYLDCRYLSAYESVWRLFQFDIHSREPTVERLTVHMPLMNNIIYHESQSLSDVVNRFNIEKTMFTEWIMTNSMYDDARELTYAEFPTKWVWHQDDKIWTRRKRGNRIGRIVYIHPNSGELYFLRMLLNKVKGARNYTEIKTVDGVVHGTFRAACDAIGLLGDDLEWRNALEEANYWSSASNL